MVIYNYKVTLLKTKLENVNKTILNLKFLKIKIKKKKN